MQTFNALKTYLDRWNTEREREDKRLQRLALEQDKKDAETAVEQYEEFCIARVQAAIDAMAPEERSALTERATNQLVLDFPETKKFLSGHILSVERSLIKSSVDLPDFETWKSDS